MDIIIGGVYQGKLDYTPPSHAARGQTRGAPFMGHLALFLNMGIHLAFFRVRR